MDEYSYKIGSPLTIAGGSTNYIAEAVKRFKRETDGLGF